MKYQLLCVTLSYLFFIHQAQSLKIESAKYDDPITKSVNFDVKSSFTLSCNVAEDKNVTGEVKWKKDGEYVSKVESLKDRIKLHNTEKVYNLQIQRSQERDAGNYTCLVESEGNTKSSQDIVVTSTMAVKVQANINVVEGDKLRIHCLTIGNPPPVLRWTFANESNVLTDVDSLDHISLSDDEEKHNPNAILIIDAIKMSDRGEYTCIGTSPVTGESYSSISMVRIKDKYAALWPFLGICAEVIILCAIIFIYEKKRNKTELEESDTDQSPDQKNTPDNGKDSNLRHRQ